jgi:hypothetical protein
MLAMSPSAPPKVTDAEPAATARAPFGFAMIRTMTPKRTEATVSRASSVAASGSPA